MIMSWNRKEEKILARLHTPAAIQEFIDTTEYSADPIYRCPRSVLRDRRAHCMDGAVFAAAALDRLGRPPTLLDLAAVRDDDHVIAVFREGRLFGAIAKSNFSTLRFREPVYRSLRELAMSYFEFYFNVECEKSLRSYSRLLDLASFGSLPWRTEDSAIEPIAERLYEIRHYPLLLPGIAERLNKADARSYAAATVGVNPLGLYIPSEHE